MIFDQYSRYKACSDLLRQTGFKTGIPFSTLAAARNACLGNS